MPSMMQERGTRINGSDVRSELVDPDAFVCRAVLAERRVSSCRTVCRRRNGTHNKGEERVFFHLAARLEEDVQLLGRLDACVHPRFVESEGQSVSLGLTILPLQTFLSGSPCNF